MKAMVLAAGRGERLRPITDQTPKALIPVAGRPMIEYPLLLLRHAGITEIVINLHHLGAQIEDYLGDGRRLGLKIHYSREERLLDTGGAVRRAKPFLGDGTFIIINSDVLIDLRLQDLIAFHSRREAVATLVLRPDEKAEEFGAIECAEDGRIHRFLNVDIRTGSRAASKKRMFTGLQVIAPSIFDFMEEDGPFSLTRGTYARLVALGKPLYGFDYFGFWQDLGTAERIKQAEETLRREEVRLHYL
ncbi:MAG TPA: NDP-sugar synthase [Candidatus Acidoferrales bacterium]|nr:NDP-sugar synthase [Candidatus Acidoferrales bacterium]